ncbi:PREDICTED: probable G-protein coupled receptor 45, partial [Myotis brandtii]|uniref:probable G-protein coupled receptor 45 n=1 Tax=Myotis brandtii TaxID=109478 RepID=UPI000703DABF
CLASPLVLMIAVGFLGNSVVCVIVYQRPAMRSAINLLLATLAFSDIMLSLCCMPFAAATLVTVRWRFGDSFCRLSAALYWFFVLEGVAALLIISVDRFLIIAQRQDRLTPRRAKRVGLRRRQRQQQVSLDLSFKTKAFTTILILFVGFSLCWLPHAVYSLLSVFSRRFYCSPSFYTTSSCVLWLGYIKSVFNPIVYCWRIKKFREACIELLPQTFQILPRVPERIRRRVQPSTIYTCNENQSAV